MLFRSGFKCLQTNSFSTFGYYNIVVNASIFSQTSGVRDFNLEYKLGAGGTWTSAGSIVVGNTLANYPITLPVACNNQSSVYVRWIATSYTGVGGAAITAAKYNYF